MKKVFSLFMALLLAISLFACGKEESKEPTIPTPATPEQVIPETPIVPPETSATPPESELSEIEKEMRLIEDTAPYYADVSFGSGGIHVNLSSNNEESWIQHDVVTLEIKFDYKNNSMTLQTNDRYMQILADKEYSFDLYFATKDSIPKEYVKVNLPIHSVMGKSGYFCKFYDVLSPYLYPDMYRRAMIVLREGENILGWGEANLSWTEYDHQRMTSCVSSGEYEY